MVPYLDYPNMKEFYTIAEVGRLFKMEKKDLKIYSERFEIFPVKDQFGNYGFPKKELRKLHNKIYREQRPLTRRCIIPTRRTPGHDLNSHGQGGRLTSQNQPATGT